MKAVELNGIFNISKIYSHKSCRS